MKFGWMGKRPDQRDIYIQYVEQFMADAYFDMEVCTFADGEALLQSVNEKPIDILFYDFEGDEDFLYTVQQVVAKTATCQLVLVGDDTRNAILGYALKAKDYLVHPIDEDDFIDTVARLVREAMEQIQQMIPIKTGGHWGTLPAKRITHVESLGHYVSFHMDDGESFKTLGKHQDFARHWQVNGDFVRVHQSYVVNLNHVQEVANKNITLTDGTQVPVSRAYLGQTKRALSLYQLQRYEMEPDAYRKEKSTKAKSVPTKGGNAL